MKFCSLRRTLLALAGVAGVSLGLTSCSNDHTVGYAYVLGTSANGQPAGQIGEFREDNNNGTLTAVTGSPLGSGGLNPVRMVIPAGNRFAYVLNAGVPQTDASQANADGSANPLYGQINGYSSSGIQLFTVGGFGQLSSQLSYASQGFGSQRVLADSSGAHLFVLDEYANVGVASNTAAPISQAGPSANYPCQDPTNPNIYHPTGAITVFSIDGSTGRLGVLQNQRQQNLTYFPVGCYPVDFRIAGGFLYTMDAGSKTTGDLQTVNVYSVASTGQLTPTQTSQIQVTSDNSTNITAITGDSAGRYVYLLDSALNRIFLYTVGSSGALTAITGSPYNDLSNSQAGYPVQTLTDSTGKYAYVINAGPAAGTSNANSDISGFSVDATTGYFDASTQQSPYAGTVSGPVCIFEDPTNQYIYVAGSLDNSITGRRIDPNTGTLVPLRTTATVPTVGTPSWCVGISSAL